MDGLVAQAPPLCWGEGVGGQDGWYNTAIAFEACQADGNKVRATALDLYKAF